MARTKVTRREARLFQTLTERSSAWMTSRELSVVSGIPDRTTRRVIKGFIEQDIIDASHTSPGSLYRIAENARDRNSIYIKSLEEAIKVFNL